MLYLTPFLTAYFLLLAALLGAVLGSFGHCLAGRMLAGESMAGRSRCPACGHTLGVRDLVPILSYLLLRRRCRYCQAPIHWRYPASELALALAFVLLTLRYNITLELAQFLLLAVILLVLTLCDLDEYLLPDVLLLAGVVVRVAYVLLSGDILTLALRSLVGGLSVSLPLLLLVLAADKFLGRETMGGGDIKLLFMLGLYFPWQQNLLLLIVACLLGLALALLFPPKDPQRHIPFGPAISLAAIFVAIFGAKVMGWYLSLF